LDLLKGFARGTANFIANTATGMLQVAVAVAKDNGQFGYNTATLVADPVLNAVQDYREKGVSGVANAVLDQGEQGAMAIVTEAVLMGGVTAASLKTPIESAATGIKAIGTGVPNADIVVRGGTNPPPPGSGTYSEHMALPFWMREEVFLTVKCRPPRRGRFGGREDKSGQPPRLPTRVDLLILGM
jgi:hypothetical protein